MVSQQAYKVTKAARVGLLVAVRKHAMSEASLSPWSCNRALHYLYGIEHDGAGLPHSTALTISPLPQPDPSGWYSNSLSYLYGGDHVLGSRSRQYTALSIGRKNFKSIKGLHSQYKITLAPSLRTTKTNAREERNRAMVLAAKAVKEKRSAARLANKRPKITKVISLPVRKVMGEGRQSAAQEKHGMSEMSNSELRSQILKAINPKSKGSDQTTSDEVTRLTAENARLRQILKALGDIASEETTDFEPSVSPNGTKSVRQAFIGKRHLSPNWSPTPTRKISAPTYYERKGPHLTPRVELDQAPSTRSSQRRQKPLKKPLAQAPDESSSGKPDLPSDEASEALLAKLIKEQRQQYEDRSQKKPSATVDPQ